MPSSQQPNPTGPHNLFDPEAMQIIPLADGKEHLQELAELHHAEWGHYNPSSTVQKRAEALEEAAGRQGIPSIFIAITSEDELIGSAALVQKDMDSRPDLSPWLAAVYVKERFRGQGMASALVARCEDEALKSGVTTWYLFTEHASSLYAKLGWQPMERCDHKGTLVDIMYKELGPGAS